MLARLTRKPLPAQHWPGVVPHGLNLLAHARGLAVEQHLARWAQTKVVLNALPISQHTTRKVGATRAEATAFFEKVQAHPLIRGIHEYVPNGGCFAKAFVAHLVGLQDGYHKDSFLKLIHAWNDETISHHVVLGLRREDGGWWALDFLYDGPKKLEEWAGYTTYAAPANRWGPEGLDAEKYSREHFWRWADASTGRVDPSQPLYNDLMGAVKKWFSENPRGKARVSREGPFDARATPVLADQQTLATAARLSMTDAFAPATPRPRNRRNGPRE